jgi:hypothetical protein
MRMAMCDIRPGVILKVVDNYGTIKASAQGIFSEEDDPDLLPPITQFILPSSTSFSMPHEGDNVWVWHFEDNPQELLYTFRGNTQNLNGDELDNEYKDVEIQMKRKSDNGEIQVSYNDDDGYTVDNSGSQINIDNKDHEIHLKCKGGKEVSINKDGISLGKDGGSKYKAVCGEELIKSLDDIKNVLNAIKDAAMGNPYTMPIGTAMTPLLPKLNTFKKMLSNVVTLEK